MGSGKRASMREGPLAALFRKTETEGLRAAPRAAAPRRRAPAPPPEPPPPEPPRVPTPQERLRHAFSSDLPENIMAPPARPRRRRAAPPTTRRAPEPVGVARSCASSASAAPASTPSTA